MSAAEDEPARQVLDLVTGAWRTQIVHAAVALRVPDLVALGCSTSVELARATGTVVDGMERLVRALCRLGVLTEADGLLDTTPTGRLLEEGQESFRDLVLLYGQEFYIAWSGLLGTVTTGDPAFAATFGAELGDHLRTEPEASARFQAAMAAGNVFFRELPRRHTFAPGSRLVDVAGGDGQLLRALVAAVPGATGVLVEQPHVAASVRAAPGPHPERIEIVDADVFSSVPAGGDVYLLSRVLQDWDDKRCCVLLRTCAQAMSYGAELVVVDRVLDPDAVLPALWDLHLMVVAGGRERTEAAYAQLLDDAGLRLCERVDLPLEMSALVARRA